MLPYERFDAWRAAHELVLDVYRATNGFPPPEKYGLTIQARRAAFSVAANIAEGSAKRGPREFRRYLDISIGSLSELAYTMQLARDLGLLTNEDWSRIDEWRNKTGKLVSGLCKKLRPTNPPRNSLHQGQ